MSFAIIPDGRKPVALIFKLIPVILALTGIAIMLIAHIKNDDVLEQISAKPEKGEAVITAIAEKPEFRRITYSVYDESFDQTYQLKRDFSIGEIKAIDKAKEGDALPIRFSYTTDRRVLDENVVFTSIADEYYTMIYIGVGVIVLGMLYIVPVAIACSRFAKYGYTAKHKIKKQLKKS